MGHLFEQPVELQAEVEAVENALELATQTGQPQVVEIDGQKCEVIDPGYAGREIRPL